MKFYLCIALFATAFLAAQARPSPTTRELIQLLEKIVKKGIDSGSEDPLAELHAGIHGIVQKHAGDVADVPVFEVDHEIVGPLFLDVIQTMATHIPEELLPVVGARFAQAFMNVLIVDGMDTVWHIAAHHLTLKAELTGDADDIVSVAPAKRRWAKREMPTEGKGMDFWGGVFEVLIGPNYEFLEEISKPLAAIDAHYYGNFYMDMYYLAEDEGLLGRSLEECAIEVGEHLAAAMYTPTAAEVPVDLLPNMLGSVAKWVAGLKAFSADSVADIEMAPEEKEAFIAVVEMLIPMIDGFIEPVENMLNLFQEDAEKLPEFFLSVLAHTLEEQYNELRSVLMVVKKGAEVKADVIDRLIGNISNGKGKDVFVALFTKMAHHALNIGYDLEEYMHWAGNLLDQVDADFNGPIVKPDDDVVDWGSTNKIGDMKRFKGKGSF